VSWSELRQRTVGSWVKEVEILGRTVAKLKVRLDDGRATLITEDFESVHDNAPRRTRPPAPETESDDDDVQMQPRNIREPPLTGGKAIKYIPILNGDDDIGVEDFVADVRAIRNVCTQKALLLRAIKIEKIIGQAAQGIRNIRIENYTNLFDAFRQNVAAQVASDEYAEQLRELRQGRDESVQSFNISFRQVLNRLTYAITNEKPQPLTRKITLEKVMKGVSRTYLRGLRTEVGRMLMPSEPSTLVEAKKEAGAIERFLREEQQRGVQPMNRYPEKRPQMERFTTGRGAIPRRNSVRTNDAMQTKCFKCGKIGHITPQCPNFQSPSQRNRPPLRDNQIEREPDYITEEINKDTEEQSYWNEEYQGSTRPREDCLQYILRGMTDQ
jgi:hypothetical protein